MALLLLANPPFFDWVGVEPSVWVRIRVRVWGWIQCNGLTFLLLLYLRFGLALCWFDLFWIIITLIRMWIGIKVRLMVIGIVTVVMGLTLGLFLLPFVRPILYTKG